MSRRKQYKGSVYYLGRWGGAHVIDARSVCGGCGTKFFGTPTRCPSCRRPVTPKPTKGNGR